MDKRKGCWGAETSFLWGKRWKGFVTQIASSFFGAWRGPLVTPLVLDQNIPDWLMKILFLAEVKTSIRLGIKSRFRIMGF